mmetsp:Transcript_39204/g.94777  ORF Transcript_39204/g.94777 Transcript_39204/m.94777 type:complete len:95 (-) Transcript_39204:1330-1614(-)
MSKLAFARIQVNPGGPVVILDPDAVHLTTMRIYCQASILKMLIYHWEDISGVANNFIDKLQPSCGQSSLQSLVIWKDFEMLRRGLDPLGKVRGE